MAAIENWGEYQVDVIEDRRGYTMDDNGYRQETHNLRAAIGHEVDADGNRTGRIVATATDGGNLTQVEVVDSEDLDAWLMDWDGEYLEDFRTENILATKNEETKMENTQKTSGRYFSRDDRWGTEPADFESFEAAVVAAIDSFDLTRDEAEEFCRDAEGAPDAE